MARVLIVDDDELFCDMLSRSVSRLGHETRCAHTLESGLREANAERFDVVYLDVNLPDGSGLVALLRIKDMELAPEVIIITGSGDPDAAELAIKHDAWDYIGKSSSREAMTLPLVRALKYREQKHTAKTPLVIDHEGIIGDAPCMKRCYELLAQAAGSETNVLINGETGTGKELFASAIHRNSSQGKANFVVVDCAALPGSLVESILFGHKKGAFTGADRDREGLIAQADGGTLFLDEIGELPLSLQKVFLRVLQERRFRPIGGEREVRSHFRLIAVTNRRLEEMVKNGSFRQDLLFRLRSFVIDLPPLRERRKDIRALVMHYIGMLCERTGVATKGFSPDFFEALMAFDWPGNVRELLQIMERVFAVAGEDAILYPKHLPTHLRVQLTRATVSAHAPFPEPTESAAASPPSTQMLREAREEAVAEAERRYLENLMISTRGNMKDACDVSGVAHSQLYSLLKKYNIPRMR